MKYWSLYLLNEVPIFSFDLIPVPSSLPSLEPYLAIGFHSIPITIKLYEQFLGFFNLLDLGEIEMAVEQSSKFVSLILNAYLRFESSFPSPTQPFSFFQIFLSLNKLFPGR